MEKVDMYALVGDELLVAVFSKFEKGKKYSMKKTGPFSWAFHTPSKNPLYAQLFQNYHFTEGKHGPSSQEINNGVAQMQENHLMFKAGDFYLTELVDDHWREIRRKLTTQQVSLVRKLAKEMLAKWSPISQKDTNIPWKYVMHHDDSPCRERLKTKNGGDWCPKCKLHPDMQSKSLWHYCPNCDIPLKDSKCPDCKKTFIEPS